MKIQVLFPTKTVEFDSEDLNALTQLLEKAVPLAESGYGSSKTFYPHDEPITISFPLAKKAKVSIEPAPKSEVDFE